MSIVHWDEAETDDQIAVVARYTFKPEHASDFSPDGNQIVEIAFETIEEAQEFAVEFEDCLLEVNVIFDGLVINLSDYRYDA
tara:strand:+ start:270 stop:515 length:246 start_codon:yes stop_codon:yes gene_type:complete